MSTPQRKPVAGQQRQAAESETAKRAQARRDQPNEIVQRALMQRQAKGLHQKDGK